MQVPQILKPTRKKIIILIGLIILGFFIFNRFSKPKVESLQITQVQRADIAQTISSAGILTGKDVVDLKFRIGGKIYSLNVKAGDQVNKGDVIATLDTQQLSIDLQQARNTLRDKQAAVEEIEDDVKDHDDDESFTQKADRTAAQVARDNAFDSVKEAQRAFQDAVIVSPIFGIVTQVNAIPGEVVSASEVIVQVADFSSFYFDTDVDESDINQVAVGTPTNVSLDAYPDQLFIGFVD